jgi:hypothetical protein
MRDTDAMKQMFASETESSKSEGFQSEPVDEPTLQKIGIELAAGESYGWLQTTLLNKVEISGVIRSQRYEGENYLAIVWKLDERFAGPTSLSQRYENTWRKLERDELGNLARSEDHPYAGSAGYLFVTSLQDQPEASLLEGEVILHEAEDWFGGSNLLRSKLPLIIQESARKLRRGVN